MLWYVSFFNSSFSFSFFYSFSYFFLIFFLFLFLFLFFIFICFFDLLLLIPFYQRVLSKYGNLRKLLTTAYPSHPWHIKPKPRPVDPSSSSPSPSSSSPPPSSPSPSSTRSPSKPISNELPKLDSEEPLVENFVYNCMLSLFVNPHCLLILSFYIFRE